MASNNAYKPSLPPRQLTDHTKKIIGFQFQKYRQNKYHEAKVIPIEYQKAVKALKLFEKQNIPIENVIDPESPEFIEKEAYFLAQKTLDRIDQINYILDKLEILKNNTILNPWLARVVTTDILFCRHQNARSLSNEVETIKFYEESMRDLFVETKALVPHESDERLPVYVRINTISISIDDCIRAFLKEGWNLLPRSKTYNDYLYTLRHLEGKDFMRDFHISELLIFPSDTIFYNHPGYLKGKFLLQDKGSCLSSFLLNPKPGSVVLDICAAPGLKTNHLANIMNNEGLIIANDDHPLRFETLCNLLELTNAKCVQPCQFDQFNVHTSVANVEDIRYILVDPTCSYSGLFYKSSKNASKVRLHKIRFKCTILLKHCLQNFPNLKRLVYTTYSIYPEEGEKVIGDILEEIGNSYTLLNAKEMLWNEWKDLGINCEYLYKKFEHSEKCLRTLPERDLTPGYFIAVFERNFDVPIPPYRKKYKVGSKRYYAEELELVDKHKPSGKVVKTYVPKTRLEAEQMPEQMPEQILEQMPRKMPAIPTKNKTIFAKVQKMFKYKDKVEKAASVINNTIQPPANKYKYISKEYRMKQLQRPQQEQQSFSQQEIPQEFPQKKIQPSASFIKKNPQQPFPKKKSELPAKPKLVSYELVSYPILNKLKGQQFSQPPQSQYSQTKPQVQYSQTKPQGQYSQTKPQVQYSQTKPQVQYSQTKPQVQYSQQKQESQYSQSKPLLQYSQPKLQSQFTSSIRHQQLGLVSYPIFNKLMSSNKYYDNDDDDNDDNNDDVEEDDYETSPNQLYP